MSTLGAVKARIASKLKRSDLTTSIADEIASAIRFYQAKRFWFSETPTVVSFSTVDGQDIYDSSDAAAIPDLLKIDWVQLTDASGIVHDLNLMSWRAIAHLNDGQATNGRPVRYAYYGQQLRLYPIPDAEVCTVKVAGVSKLGIPSSDGASNAWTTEAEDLIVHRVLKMIYGTELLDMAAAQAMDVAEKEYLRQLEIETDRRNPDNTLKPSCI